MNPARPAFSSISGGLSTDPRLDPVVSASPGVSASLCGPRVDQPLDEAGGTLDDLQAPDLWARVDVWGTHDVSFVLGDARLAPTDRRR